MKLVLAAAAILCVATVFGQDCCKDKQGSSCCKASADLAITLKGIKDNAGVCEAFQKRFGGGCTLDGHQISVKVPEKSGILLSDLWSAAEESSVQIDEGALSARCLTVWFEEKPAALIEKFPEYAFGEPEDGTTSLAFGANTSMTLADLRKIGKIKQGQFNAAAPKTGGCCGGKK